MYKTLLVILALTQGGGRLACISTTSTMTCMWYSASGLSWGRYTDLATSHSRPLSNDSACHILWEVDPPILQLKSRSWERSVGGGGGGGGGEKGAQFFALAHDVERLTCQLEVQPGAMTEGSCYQVPGLASQEWPWRLVRPEHSWFTRTVPAWQHFYNTNRNYWINNLRLLKQ